jgi:hypothetical protein
MMTRLVLVGMVAALGITAPTWGQIQGWMGALHCWTASRLERWDTSRSHEADFVVAVSPVRRPRPAFEPIEPDDKVSKVADELNRTSDGLDLRPESAHASRSRVMAGTETPSAGRHRRASRREFGLDWREFEWMAEWRGNVEPPIADARPDEMPAAGRRSKAMLDPPIACVFTASATMVTPAHSVAASGVETRERPPMIWPKADLARVLATAESRLALERSRLAERIERLLPDRPAVHPAGPAFEPIDPAMCVCTSLADELNADSDSNTIARARLGEADGHARESGSTGTPVRPSAGGSRPSPEVAQAMRLTRDAVHAWVKVMSGPTAIQVSAR